MDRERSVFHVLGGLKTTKGYRIGIQTILKKDGFLVKFKKREKGDTGRREGGFVACTAAYYYIYHDNYQLHDVKNKVGGCDVT